MNLFQFSKYIPRVFYKRGMPLNLIYFITSKCNARCRHCFYWQKLNTVRDELDLDEIKKVAKSAPNLMALSLTGGEPFLRKDLAEIVSIFSQHTRVANIQIPTNGILTDCISETVEDILKKCRNNVRLVVGVSLDDLEEKHDAIRMVEGCFGRAIRTIGRLKLLENKFPNFRVGSTVTMTKANQGRMLSIVDFLKKELNLREVGINLVRSDVKDMSLKKLDIRYYQEATARLRESFNQQKNLFGVEQVLSARQRLGSQLLGRIYSENRYITPCYAGSLLAIMKENGDIYPCEMLNNKMGSLKDFNFNLTKLWFSSEAEKVRKQIKKTKCFCTYECAMTLNTLFNPRHIFSILMDSLVRKKTL